MTGQRKLSTETEFQEGMASLFIQHYSDTRQLKCFTGAQKYNKKQTLRKHYNCI